MVLESVNHLNNKEKANIYSSIAELLTNQKALYLNTVVSSDPFSEVLRWVVEHTLNLKLKHTGLVMETCVFYIRCSWTRLLLVHVNFMLFDVCPATQMLYFFFYCTTGTVPDFS